MEKRIVSLLLALSMILCLLGTDAFANDTETAELKLGDYVSFGRQPNGDELLWQVIHFEDGLAMLYSAKTFTGEYDASIHMKAVTVSYTRYNSYGSASWEFSDVRQFLNARADSVEYEDVAFDYSSFGSGIASINKDSENPPSYAESKGFLNEFSFSESEYLMIEPVKHKSLIPATESGYSGYDIGKFKNFPAAVSGYYQDPDRTSEVTDRVFLLNAQEFREYVLDNGLNGYQSPTGKNYGAFWLRDSVEMNFAGFYYYYGTNILTVSNQNAEENEADLSGAIRPACCINLRYLRGLEGAGTYEEPYKLKIDVTSRAGFGIEAPEGTKLCVGQTVKLHTVGLTDEAGRNITWSSGDNRLASVDKNGTVTALAEGNVPITACAADGTSKTIWLHIISKGANLRYEYYKYSFGNTSGSFGYGKSYHYPLNRYLQVGIPLPMALSVQKENVWGGNCFGMSGTSVLFFKNYLREERYGRDVHYPIQFSRPDGRPVEDQHYERKLRELIEFVHLSQWLLDKDKRFSATAVAAELDKGNPVILGLKTTDNKSSHAVVIYGYEKSGDTYTFNIYDCSGFITSLSYENVNTWSFTYSNSMYQWKPESYCTYQQLSILITGLILAGGTNTVSLLSEGGEPENDICCIMCPMSDLTLTNSKGETSSLIEGELQGDIEGLRLLVNDYLSEDQRIKILAPRDVYDIVGAGDVTAAVGDLAVEISGEQRIILSENLHTVEVYDAPASYSVEYMTFGNFYDTVLVTGACEEGHVKLTLEPDGSAVSVENADSVKAAVTVSGQSSTVEASAENKDLVRVVFAETQDGDATVQICCGEKLLSAAKTLAVRKQTSAPTSNFESGSYDAGLNLILSADSDTLIYYTTDGTVPTQEDGILYTGPLDINRSTTIRAIAVKYGYDSSEELALTFALPEISTPTADVEPGSYDRIIRLNLSCEDGAQILYTMDNTDPARYGTVFDSTVILSENTTITACAIKDGCVSDIASFVYEVSPEDAFLLANTPTNQAGEVLNNYNLPGSTSIILVLEKLTDAERKASVMVAFYNENGKLTGICETVETFSDKVSVISVPINSRIENAAYLKVFVLDGSGKCMPAASSEDFMILN